MSRFSRRDKNARIEAFKRFNDVAGTKEWNLEDLIRRAFITGWNTGYHYRRTGK